MIQYNCPKCEKERVVSDDEAGTTYTCSCGNVNPLPAAEPTPAREPGPEPEEETVQPAFAPKQEPTDDGDDGDSPIVYEGRPSQLENLPVIVGLVLVVLATFFIFPSLFKRIGDTDRSWWWGFWFSMLVVAGYTSWLTIRMLKLRCMRYVITEESMQIESGILFKDVDNIDMFRISDVNLKQGVFQRFLGIGDIIVESSDKSLPSAVLKNIPDPRVAFEKVRKAALSADKKRGVLQIER
jgi:membrane protein YdbS with pleckstrin-like domain